MKNRLLRPLAVLLVVMMTVSMLAACNLFGGEGTTSKDGPRVLRIATLYGEGGYNDHIRTQYTDIFEYNNKNIEIEFVPAVDYSSYSGNNGEVNPMDELKKLMEGTNPPDLVMVSYEELPALIEDNLLQPLDPLITRDKFNIEGYVPAVINGLKEMGNDQLYALAPTFTASALIYNQGIFNERGVELPQDGMTWEEIFDLARRVSFGEDADRVYGFSFSKYRYDDLFYNLQQNYLAQLDLKMVGEDNVSMLVDTDSWKSVFSTIADLYREKVLPQPVDYSIQRDFSPFDYDAFLSGSTAMTIINYNQISELINVNNNAENIEGFEPITWDVVTMPVHPENPEIGGFMSLEPIFAINAKAENAEDAWSLVKFINSEDWAKLKSRSTYNLVSRAEYNQTINGENYNIDAFYKLKPAPNPFNNYRYNNNQWEVQYIGQMKLQEVFDGQKSVDEALQEWKVEGEERLRQIKENQNMMEEGIAVPFEEVEGTDEATTEIEGEAVAE